MNPLWRILLLWRGRAGVLALGAAVSVATVLVGAALMSVSGGMLAAVVAGAGMFAAPLLLRLLGPARVVLRYLDRYVTHDATFRALADLRTWFFRGLALRSAGGLGYRRAGDVLARLVVDVEALDGLYLRIVVPCLCAAALLVVLMIVLGRDDPVLAGATGLVFAIAAFVVPFWVARAVAGAGQALAEAGAELRIAVLDAVTGLREVRAFAADGRMIAAMQAREGALLAAQRRQMRAGAIAGAVALLGTELVLILVLARAHDARATAMLFLVVAASEVVALLPRAGVIAGRAAAAARRVIAAADGPASRADPVAPAALPTASGVRFEAVRFRWRPDLPLVCDGLTLDVPAGSRVAVLGPSGAGKSTLAALLLKVVAPEQGRILLGGVDIATLAAEDVRTRVGWLAQSTHLFADTIRANLLLARPDASDAQLWAALDGAMIGEVVRGLPEGLDAWIGEGGVGFSGGQGRRLALARALLSPAPVLILDEPCAGLDADTEREFYLTLNAVAEGRTILLIAHRLTGVERVDRIWRISAGHAVAAAA